MHYFETLSSKIHVSIIFGACTVEESLGCLINTWCTFTKTIRPLEKCFVETINPIVLKKSRLFDVNECIHFSIWKLLFYMLEFIDLSHFLELSINLYTFQSIMFWAI